MRQNKIKKSITVFFLLTFILFYKHVRKVDVYCWSNYAITIFLEANVLFSRLQKALSPFSSYLKEKNDLTANLRLVI